MAIEPMTIRLPADEENAGQFRQYVRACCVRHHFDDLLDTLLLVTDELVSNAVAHARPHGSTYVQLGLLPTQRGVRVEVSDDDPTLPILAADDTEQDGGRGLRVVASLAQAWGVEQRDGGKLVWAELESLPRSRPPTSPTG